MTIPTTSLKPADTAILTLIINMYFSKDTYILRRRLLMDRLGHGVAVIFGNNNSPINYPSNAYHFRQDSTMMYYTGLERDGLALVLDCDNRREILLATTSTSTILCGWDSRLRWPTWRKARELNIHAR